MCLLVKHLPTNPENNEILNGDMYSKASVLFAEHLKEPGFSVVVGASAS